MKRQLETLESRYCLSSPIHFAGGGFARHEHAEFRVASFSGGQTKVEQGGVSVSTSTTMMATTTATGWTFTGKRMETKRFGGRDGDSARNRIDGAGDRFHGGYIPAPPSMLEFPLPPGFVAELIIVNAGAAPTEANLSGATTSSDGANAGESKVSKHAVADVTATTENRDGANETLQKNPPAEASGLAGRSRVADLFSDAEPIGTSGPILASVAAPFVSRAADFAAATIQNIAADRNDGVSAANLAQRLVSQWLPEAGAIVNAPVVATASHVFVPVVERVASAAFAPAAATYQIVHLGSPFTLLADSVASFVEESAAVNNVLAHGRPAKPWGLTFTVLAADLVVVSYVYRRKKLSRRVALAPVGH